MSRAFSLVELSIVLVILGLLVGGVLTGQSLIRAAELRSVTTEFQRYQTATQTFRDRFFAIPGDMRNAVDFWGEAAAGNACNATVGTGTATCNGNGDGDVGVFSTSNERFRFWQHLANAGLIEGTYTGVAGPDSATADGVIGVNVPQSKLTNSGWMALHFVWSGSGNFTDGDYGNFLSFGSDTPSSFPNNVVLTPEEAWNIDTKIDDGQPQQGRVWAIRWNICTDAADETVRDAEYLLSDSSIACALAFLNVF